MPLSFQTIVNRINKYTETKPNEIQLNQLKKLYNEFGEKIINIPQVFAIQIDIGLEDIYDRYVEALIKIKPRDSASYNAYIIRYGEYHGKKLYELRKIKRSHSLAGYIMRHGEIDGYEKYKQYWKNTNFTTGIRSFINRFGEEEGTKLYNQLCEKNSFNATLAGYIKKYGEIEGPIKFRDVNDRKSISQSKEVLVKRMLNDGKDFDDILNEIERRWSRSLKTFVKKHGNERGTQAYNTFCQNIKNNNKISKTYYEIRNIPEDVAFDLISIEVEKRNNVNKLVSKESLFHLEDIVKSIQVLTGDTCLYKDEEFSIQLTKSEHDISNSYFFRYDFTFNELKLIIEYHGSSYHDDVDYSNTINLNEEYFKKTFNKDLYKKWIAENRGYDIIIIRSWKIKEDKIKFYEYLINRGINVCPTKFF
jgi:hypothetical protein